VPPYVRRSITVPPHFPSCDTSKGTGARRIQIVFKGHGELGGLKSGTWTAMRHVQMADTQQNNVAKQRVADLDTRMTTVIKGRSQEEFYLRTTHSGQGTERGERENIFQIVESSKKKIGATAADQVGWWVHRSQDRKAQFEECVSQSVPTTPHSCATQADHKLTEPSYGEYLDRFKQKGFL